MKDYHRRYHIDLIMLIFLFGLLLSPIGMKAAYSVGLNSNRLMVVVENGIISVDLKNAQLLDVLDEIERQSKVRFVASEALSEERLSTEFNLLPLQKGLKRIFSHMSHVIEYDRDHKISRVLLFETDLSQDVRFAEREVEDSIRPLTTTPFVHDLEVDISGPFQVAQNFPHPEGP